MNVGIFGGSFNPPHLAHLIIAERVREACDLDLVLWIPCFLPPHKPDEHLAPAEHRMAMVRLAVKDDPSFEVSDLEMRLGGISYTVETLRALQSANPETTFSLILGGDSFRALGAWHRPEEIVELASLIVYERPLVISVAEASPFAAHAHFVDAPMLEVSSTEIRERVRAGRSIRYLVPEAVAAYIEAHSLYRD